VRAPEETQLGLKAWQQQRHNSRWRFARRCALIGSLASAVGWNLPEPVNPFVLVGIVEPLGQLRLAQAQAITAAVHAKEVARRAERPAPKLLETRLEPLPPAPFPALDVRCLAQAVYFDARGDNLAGQIGVAQVLMNRHRASSGATLCQIFAAAMARGELCRSALACPSKATPSASNRFWMQAQWIAEEVAAGRAYLRELEHAQRYHYYLTQPAWRLTQRPVRRLGQNIFYVAAADEPDMTFASARRPWDEAAQFEMIGEEQSLSAGQLVTSSTPAPAILRKPAPAARAVDTGPAFNPFANTNDNR
jgi:spore germination cell wall hydrolase CwlJ-like protein